MTGRSLRVVSRVALTRPRRPRPQPVCRRGTRRRKLSLFFFSKGFWYTLARARRGKSKLNVSRRSTAGYVCDSETNFREIPPKCREKSLSLRAARVKWIIEPNSRRKSAFSLFSAKKAFENPRRAHFRTRFHQDEGPHTHTHTHSDAGLVASASIFSIMSAAASSSASKSTAS